MNELTALDVINSTDRYGNNIDFPDEVMSDLTTKGLLGKWTAMVYHDIKNGLYAYHMTKCKNDKSKQAVIDTFNDIHGKLKIIVPILEDLTSNRIYGIEDIFIAVFGITSDEVYVVRKYLHLEETMSTWDESVMWDNCKTDLRLAEILIS